MRQEVMGFWDAVASAGPYANNLHLAPDAPHHTNTSSLSFYWPYMMLFLTPINSPLSSSITP